VNSARSFDGGITWQQPLIVYAPPLSSGYDAGSPQVAVCPLTGKITVVYMTNEPYSAATGNGQAGRSLQGCSGLWPDCARLQISSTFLNAQNASAPLNWTASPLGNVPLLTESAYWPAFFLDVSSTLTAEPSAAEQGAPAPLATANSGAAAEAALAPKRTPGVGLVYSLRVAYQATDGSAAMTDGSFCID
jgi:hypothetical protein